MKKSRIFILVFAAIAITAFALFYLKIFGSNTSFNEKSTVFYIRTGSSFSDLIQQLEEEGVLKNVSSFEWTCRLKKFREGIKPGRYRIRNGLSNNEMVNMFRSGNQEPLLVAIENIHDLSQLAALLGRNLESDSSYFADALLDPNNAAHFGFTPELFPAMFIADSYEMWWTISPNDFLERMKEEYDDFWNDGKKKKADALNLSPQEVYTLASIVKGETGRNDEAPKIAALYLNRLEAGMKLQADPTVVFAMKSFDVKRLYYIDYDFASPYNTYLYSGLPPGPVAITEKLYLNAVLDSENHTYIYMCAKPDLSGYHNFSNSYEQHKVYAKQYHDALSKRNISR